MIASTISHTVSVQHRGQDYDASMHITASNDAPPFNYFGTNDQILFLYNELKKFAKEQTETDFIVQIYVNTSSL